MDGILHGIDFDFTGTSTYYFFNAHSFNLQYLSDFINIYGKNHDKFYFDNLENLKKN